MPVLLFGISFAMPIQALIFDFDGMILDTETTEWQIWQAIYAEHGCHLELSVWSQHIGRTNDFFDPYLHLEKLSGRRIHRESLREEKRRRVRELNVNLELRPGVQTYLRDALRLGLRVGIASSSASAWVCGHLERMGIIGRFSCITCAEHTTAHKPDPAPYLATLECLGAAPGLAIAFEDSPTGIAAATAAGIFCVAVPNPLTRNLDLSAADLRIESLAALPLEILLAHAQRPSSVADQPTI